MSELHRQSIAVLASGGGTTFEAFVHATQDGRVDAEVGLVICNNPPDKAGVYKRVANLNNEFGLDIETAMINSRTHPGGYVEQGKMTLEESNAICRVINSGKFAHVALMGYMKTVNGPLLEMYGYNPHLASIYDARMSNTHPGPLPETKNTYGLNTSQRVLDLGMAASRHTVHLVASGIDEGPILAEHSVPVLEGDTAQSLFDRVQIVEKAALPVAIDEFLHAQQDYYRKQGEHLGDS